ncbi:TPA: hypothetical protein TVN94_002012 [Streptococcus equi subsp. zooepidemicus]|uniref:hypothetical protein n=1 Tax=Streptococcus equi TaxID=1336 RepID=UPI00197F94B3|nr:hypothetical protein [Streptococcus equi]MCD3406617.1 hypothetical protein [Streptococcus equi subsp. zooepidemicus]MDI5901548.1 hypothetical protein [Streptococcus equi subsp. zooepidemicus]MDI5947987.1 hypothetical protein [Streptococcus equi subsp. zooepidemicus]MDI5959178.1 hypothetical protein [Streptococcus equi subsp. zooepidemicus]MDI5961092.1 hypothetical protein [Streptococcus equi subsp. zooepidemicus]
MTTDRKYSQFAKRVYDVDSKKKKVPLKKGGSIFNKKYRVLEAEDNPDNGMQVRTVGAIKGGEVGKSHIIIVYAGINHLTAT